MKLYLTGPMTGLPNFNYPAFAEWKEKLEERGYEVNSPHLCEPDPENYPPGSRSWSFYMKRCIEMLMQSDAVAILPEWEQSKGAYLEVMIAHQCGMAVRPAHIWLMRRPHDFR